MNNSLASELLIHIPTTDWPLLKPRLIDYIADHMPSNIIEKLMGDTSAIDGAFDFLHNYYRLDDTDELLLNDMLSIFGEDCIVSLIQDFLS